MAETVFVQVRIKKSKGGDLETIGLVPEKALDHWKSRGYEEVPATKQVDVVPVPELTDGTATGAEK